MNNTIFFILLIIDDVSCTVRKQPSFCVKVVGARHASVSSVVWTSHHKWLWILWMWATRKLNLFFFHFYFILQGSYGALNSLNFSFFYSRPGNYLNLAMNLAILENDNNKSVSVVQFSTSLYTVILLLVRNQTTLVTIYDLVAFPNIYQCAVQQ